MPSNNGSITARSGGGSSSAGDSSHGGGSVVSEETKAIFLEKVSHFLYSDTTPLFGYVQTSICTFASASTSNQGSKSDGRQIDVHPT